VTRYELPFRRLAEDDSLGFEIEVVGFTHPVTTNFLAYDEEEGYVVRGDLFVGDETVDGGELGGDAGFVVYAAAALDGGVGAAVGVEGRDLP